MNKLSFKKCMLAVALTALLSPVASASDVSVYGGFTTFTGVVSGNAISSIINGTRYCPDSGCATLYDVAHVKFPTPQAGLDFYDADSTGFHTTENVVEFTPAAPQAVSGPGVDFLLGTFTFANGIWDGDADIGLTLTTSSTDSSLDGHTFTGFVHMTLTPNDFDNQTPEQNADYFSLEDSSGNLLNLPSMRVYELADSPTGSNTGSVALYGHIGSLDLTSLQNPTGGLFLNDSHDPLSAPEPGSMALIAVGLGTMAMRRARRK